MIAAAQTRRQPSSARLTSPVKYGSSSRFASLGLRSKASLIRPRKALRMMQPPRHMRATPPLLISHFDSSRHGLHQAEALGVGDDLGGVEGLLEVVHHRLVVACKWCAMALEHPEAVTRSSF